MTAEEFSVHESFSRHDGVYTYEDADFTATVDPGSGRLRVELPDIDAAVVGETVGEAVREGWFQTLRRRLGDAPDAARGDHDPPTVEREGETVVVTFDLVDPAADDAVALVGFVEGTWFQGIVPGYEYREDVAAMRARARRAGDS